MLSGDAAGSPPALKRYPIVLGAGVPLFSSDTGTARPFTVIDEHAVGGDIRVTIYARAD